jgi:hypothetical protein
LLFSDVARRSVAIPAFASTSAAVLAYLRQQTFPKLVEPPQFKPSSRAVAAQPGWLERSSWRLGRQAIIALLAVASVVLVVTSLPAWGDLASSSSSPAVESAVVRSSSGATGDASTRVERLGAHSFVGRNPFVSRALLLSEASAARSPFEFVAGARQASIADYVSGLGFSAAVPYQDAALEAQRTLNAWNSAVIEEVLEQRMATESSAALASGPPGGAIWSSNMAAGTLISNVTVTFYACAGNGFCGNMASGYQVYPGAAACSYDMAFGTKFVVVNDPTQRVFTCLDRGALATPWVDIWFYSVAEGYAWIASVGGVSDIRIVD